MTPRDAITELQSRVNSRVVGQSQLVNRLLIALLADGHLLVEGAPGLAKTTAIKTLASWVDTDYHRIQFTPDLLPSDVVGTEIYRPQDASFEFQHGPIFHNLVLADEINRAPAKVQSALLEAMGERQVTVGRTTYELPDLFLVMATQNPIDQEGTYQLPEAQMDRFLMHVAIGYPDASAEREILEISRREALGTAVAEEDDGFVVTKEQIFAARREINHIHLSDSVEEYLLQLVLATRNPTAYSDDLGRWITFGASPRATIALDRCARAHAWLDERDFVTPEDVQAVAPDVLRHRIMASFEAAAEGHTSDHLVQALLDCVGVP